MIFSARIATCSVIGLLLLRNASLALDLTPLPYSIQGNEGPPIKAIMVTDGPAKYTFIPPSNWFVNGGGKSLSLSKGGSQSWIRFVAVPQPQDDSNKQGAAPSPTPQSGQDSAAEDLKKWAAQFVPGGATHVNFVKMTEGPCTVATHSCTEFDFSFSSYGAMQMIGVFVVDFSPAERLVALVCSDKKDFDSLRPVAITTMFSWQKLSTPAPAL